MPVRTTLALAIAALTLLAPRAADAQRLVAMNDARVEAASPDVGWSLAAALASPVLEVRRGALEGTMARLRGEPRPDGQPLLTEAVVPALLAVYASDPDVRCRLVAVLALHAIGDGAAMAELRRLLPYQPTRSVQIATLGALVDHYGIDALKGAVDLAEVADRLRKTARSPR